MICSPWSVTLPQDILAMAESSLQNKVATCSTNYTYIIIVNCDSKLSCSTNWLKFYLPMNAQNTSSRDDKVDRFALLCRNLTKTCTKVKSPTCGMC